MMTMSKENFKAFGQTKRCNVCLKDRKRISFYAHHSNKDRLNHTCKLCIEAMRKGFEIVPEQRVSVSERIKNYFEQKQ